MPISGYTTTTFKPQAQTTEIDKIIAQLQEQAGIAGAKTAGRQATIEAIFDEIIGRYGPEGTYGKAAEAMLERQKGGAVAAGTQRLISSGLYGTEVGGGLGRAWESEVGAPARLRLEDIKMERLSQAQLGKAGFLERIEDVYPDYGLISQLISQAAAGPTGQYQYPTMGGYGGYGGFGGEGAAAYPTFEGRPAGVTPAVGGTVAEQRGYTTAGERPAIEMGEPIMGAGRDVYGAAAARPGQTMRQLYEEYKAYAPHYPGTYEKWARDHAADAAATVATAKASFQRMQEKRGAGTTPRTYGQAPTRQPTLPIGGGVYGGGFSGVTRAY